MLDHNHEGDALETLNPEGLEEAAKAVLHPQVHDFVAGGADDDWTVRANAAAFERRPLRPHVLGSAGRPDARVRVLGLPLAAPVIVAPMGMQCLIHPEGERATAEAARETGLGHVLATGSSIAIEEVAPRSGPARWFQLYILRDRGVSRDLVERAIAAGYGGILLTADVPVVGHRPRDRRTPLEPPPGVRNANFEPYDTIEAGYHSYVADIEPNIGWADLNWLVDVAGPAPVVVKGVLRDDDARRAVDHGARGVVVSNHGGRQLGRVIPALDALEEVVNAIGGEATVLLDSGVRWAGDVVTALALGAEAVLVGRPVLWALAAGGQDGVTTLLRALVREIERTMTLVGAQTVADLTPDMCAPTMTR
jgi:4-hydroxymandelate oxidase